MQIREVMDETFVLLPATFTVAQARRFIEGLEFTHIIVVRSEPAQTFRYLYRRDEALARLSTGNPAADLHHAFNLHEYEGTDVRQPSADADSMPDRVVVVEHGCVRGFFDAGAPITEVHDSHRRSVTATGRRFESYPLLVAPERVEPAATFDILVGFRDDPDAAGALSGASFIAIDHEPEERCLVVIVADGITLDRTWDTIPLERNAHVKLQGTAQSAAGATSIEAQYFFRNQLVSAARCTIMVGDAVSPSATGAPANPCRAMLPSPGAHVDLTITVTYAPIGTLTWTYSAEALEFVTKTPLVTQVQGAQAFAADLLKDLKSLSHRGPLASNALESKGQDVAALMPADLFPLLRRLHTKLGRTLTVLLVTNEVFIPWELAVLDPPLDERTKPFLAAQTAMGRWLKDDQVMMPPEAALEVRRITAVAAGYGLEAGLPVLEHALAERRMLVRQWDAISVDATQADLEPVLIGAKIPGHLIHFAVHGLSDPGANDQAILLADKTHLPAVALTGRHRCGQVPRFSFVFLNACQVGTAGVSLGQAAGFPGILVRRGAVGFVAPLWDVDDEVACALAERFYKATLIEGYTVGTVLQSFRRDFDGEGSTTPMAYIYYGHPSLTLRHPIPPGDT